MVNLYEDKYLWYHHKNRNLNSVFLLFKIYFKNEFSINIVVMKMNSHLNKESSLKICLFTDKSIFLPDVGTFGLERTELLSNWATEQLRNWATEKLSNWATELLSCWATEQLRNWGTEVLMYWATEQLSY